MPAMRKAAGPDRAPGVTARSGIWLIIEWSWQVSAPRTWAGGCHGVRAHRHPQPVGGLPRHHLLEPTASPAERRVDLALAVAPRRGGVHAHDDLAEARGDGGGSVLGVDLEARAARVGRLGVG